MDTIKRYFRINIEPISNRNYVFPSVEDICALGKFLNFSINFNICNISCTYWCCSDHLSLFLHSKVFWKWNINPTLKIFSREPSKILDWFIYSFKQINISESSPINSNLSVCMWAGSVNKGSLNSSRMQNYCEKVRIYADIEGNA